MKAQHGNIAWVFRTNSIACFSEYGCCFPLDCIADKSTHLNPVVTTTDSLLNNQLNSIPYLRLLSVQQVWVAAHLLLFTPGHPLPTWHLLFHSLAHHHTIFVNSSFDASVHCDIVQTTLFHVCMELMHFRSSGLSWPP